MPRTKLPETRPSLTHRREVCGYTCYVVVSFFDDGDRARPAEVFCLVAKQGSVIAGLIDGLCRTISVSLQYGVPWMEIERGLRHSNFERKDDKHHTSILDGLAQAVNHIVTERVGIIGEKPDVSCVGQLTAGAQHLANEALKPKMVGGVRDNPIKPLLKFPRAGLSGGPMVTHERGPQGNGHMVFEDGSTFTYGFIDGEQRGWWSHEKYVRMTQAQLFEQVTSRNCNGKFKKDSPPSELIIALLREDGFDI